MVLAAALLSASGVAWAVTKTCPPDPKVCAGTSGADVLKSTSKDNNMKAKGGNDTYTNFVRSNVGKDKIKDTGGRDKLVLTDYLKSEVKTRSLDANKNGKVDSVVFFLGKGSQNWVALLGFYDDTRSKPPFRRGPGYIEGIQTKKSSSNTSNTITGNYAGGRSSGGSLSLECYTFYPNRTVELRHGGLPAVNDTGYYKGDATGGQISWNSGRVSSVVAQSDGSLIISGIKVTPIKQHCKSL